jgi:hypothetical protein
VHGSHWWQNIIPRKDDFDKIIFLGDLVDCWEPEYPDHLINICKIFDFKKENSEKVEILLGNHSTSYILNEQCSGYQYHHSFDIKEVYNKHKELYNIIYIYKNYIFSHAGVSELWMRNCKIKSPEEINQLFKEKPNFFRWVGPNYYGDSPHEGPLWIRPNSLIKSAVKSYTQICGHSEFDEIEWPIKFKNINEDDLIFIDTPKHNHIYEIEI